MSAPDTVAIALCVLAALVVLGVGLSWAYNTGWHAGYDDGVGCHKAIKRVTDGPL